MKDIPYFDLKKQKEIDVFDYHYKPLGQKSYSRQYDLLNTSDKYNIVRNEIDNDKLFAMKEFLTFFIKHKNEITKKIERISLIEKSGEPYYTNNINDNNYSNIY